MLLADWAEESAHTTLRSLAVLLPDRTSVEILPRLGPKLTLYGRQLDGNCMLGEQSEASIAQFIERIKQLLVPGQEQCLTIEDLDTESPLWSALHALNGRQYAVFHRRVPEPHWWLDFPENPADYWQKFSTRTRKKFRHRKRELGARLVSYRSPDQVPALFAQMDEVWNQSWKAERGRSKPRTDEVARDRWQRLAGMGALRGYVLEHEGKPIAFRRTIQWNGTLVLEETAYVESMAAASPGTILLQEVIDDLIANNTPRRVDFGFGDVAHKRLFGTRQRMSGSVTVVPRRAWPMAVMCTDAFKRRAIVAVKAALINLGAMSVAEQIHAEWLTHWLTR
jgi:CelD/BcsL family acetyltransferase involved in cellulose biosynthesis